MGNTTIDASEVSVCNQLERETVDAGLIVDIAVALPIFDEETMPDIKIDLDYNAITNAVNDYIRKSVIDSRIDKINYSLSIPQLPDNQTTQNLIDVLTGEKDFVSTINGNVRVNNGAIADDKVTLHFELSVEENVYLKSDNQEKIERPENNCINTLNAVNKDLIIKSGKPKLYLENAKTVSSLQELPHKSTTKNRDDSDIVNQSISTMKSWGDAVVTAADSIKSAHFDYAKVGDNGKIYTNPYARGNGSYKIVGKLSDNQAVRKLGTAGKIISYGSTIVQTGIEVKNAETNTEKGKAIGGASGEIAVGTIAGTVASTVTTTVLVGIAGAAGVAAAPVTIVIIAGCAIVAGVTASNATEKYGREYGEKAGAKVVETSGKLFESGKVLLHEVQKYPQKN